MPVVWIRVGHTRRKGSARFTKMTRAMMDDRWFSVDEIAAYLGIKRDTVYRLIAEKGMPAHRIGRLWKLRKDEVDRWVRSGGADEN